MYRRPIVTLIGNGDQVTLDGVGSEFTLKPGMTGTGTAPREFTFAELARGGSVMRHRRNTNIEIMIPVDVFHGYGPEAYGKLEDSRRRLEHICVGLVEIRLETKDGLRSAFGYLKDGLEGDFSKAVVNHCRMSLPLTFECPDAWWYGSAQVLTQKVDVGRKPFITSSPEPITTGRVNLAENPSFSSLRAQMYGGTIGATSLVSLSLSQEWSTSGGNSLKLTPTSTPNTTTAEVINRGNPASSADAGKTITVSADFHMEAPQTGSLWADARRIVIRGSGNSTVATSPQAANEPGTTRLSTTFTLPDNTESWYILLANGSNSVPVWWDSLLIEEVNTQLSYFDGDSPLSGDFAYGWDGEANRSASIEYIAKSVQRVPFFPVLLASSTVEGAYVLDIQGDAEAWPIWEIDGPGEDLLIEDVLTGKRIFISGDFGETVTIDTRAGDIYSDSFTHGELWDRVSLDSDLFALAPGRNRIKITMVNTRPNSEVRLRYRETFRAGH